jgi:methionyl-tRNA formyltransferase
MRIVLMGQAAFGEKVLEALLEKRREIVAVFVPPDRPGARIDPLKASAQTRGIPVFQPQRMRSPEVLRSFEGLAPDLGVMAFVTDIVPSSILNCPRLGTIQYHPSLLPRHRGGSAINWAIINDDKRTGITVFWPDEGIDTGPILLQKEADIAPDDTVGSLYFNKLFPLGVEAILEAVELVEQGSAPRVPQDETQATHEGLHQEKGAVIDWAEPIHKVYNLIRGSNPQPGATTWLRGQKLKVFDCVPFAQDATATPGDIIGLSEDGIAVASQGGYLLIRRVQPDGQHKTSASEHAASIGLREGERLG